MAFLVELPQNKNVEREVGRYPTHLNVLDRRMSGVQKSLHYKGLAGYEPETQAAILSLIQTQTHSVFYDVGAHVGIYSALVSSIFRGRAPDVLAFEPTPETARICKRIAKANNLSFRIIQAAVSRQDGLADLFLSTTAETSNSLNADFRKGSSPVQVKTISIDTFVAKGATPPTVMKVDVETFEPEVLLGAREVIKRHRPYIVMEVLRHAQRERMAEELNKLSRDGYIFYHIEPYVPWHPKNAGDVLAEANHTCRDWLLAPEPVGQDFFDAYGVWLEAIARCDAKTNVKFRRSSGMALLRRRLLRPVEASLTVLRAALRLDR